MAEKIPENTEPRNTSADHVVTDDNLEFEDSADPGNTPSGEEEFFIPSKSKLAKKAAASALAPKQAYGFLAAVDLDLTRKAEDRLGLEGLFLAYCKNGNKAWLDPAPYINKIDEILFKFACSSSMRSKILLPFIELLITLAEKKINPTAFLMYVLNPRILNDNDWRKWHDNHYNALKIITGILADMQGRAPFNRETLGSSANRLSRDVVLVKYVGGPLARFTEAMLENEELRKRYINAWTGLNLDNSFTILFMKTNILHFMYALSGRIDFQQLIFLIEQMPEIESSFRENFPESIKINLSRIDFNLYDYDIKKSLAARKQKGFKSYDFVLEVKAYLKIIIGLLSTNAGIFLCGYFARVLSSARDPVIAGTLARLVEILDDRGGMHIYRWHVRKLRSMNKINHPDYLASIEENGGCDPEYPGAENIFVDIEIQNDDTEILRAARELGISTEALCEQVFARKNLHVNNEEEYINTIIADAGGIRKNGEFTFKDLLNAYIKKHPETGDCINSYRDDFLKGQDRKWHIKNIEPVDKLGKWLHGPLLRSVIRGIGSGFSYTLKSDSLKSLFDLYGKANKQTAINKRVEFSIPVKKITDPGRLEREEIKTQVNMQLIQSVWDMLSRSGLPSADNILMHVNGLALSINQPLEESSDKRQELLNRYAGAKIESEKKKINSALKKIDKTLENLEAKKNEYNEVMEHFSLMNDFQKIIAGLYIAADRGKTGDEFTALVTALLLQLHGKSEILSSRLEFIRSDIAVEMLTFRQFNYIINTIDTLVHTFLSDEKLHRLVGSATDKTGRFREVLRPFIITRKKEFDIESADAAIKKLLSYAKLTAERAKWQNLVEAINKKESKYFKRYCLYTSKSFMDSYYGDMGGICLSSKPDAITWNSFFNVRLVSETENEIVGIALLFGSVNGLDSYRRNCGLYWHAFAINPLHSLLSRMSTRQQLILYLNYRKLFEEVSAVTGRIVVLSGVSSYGILSNDSSFRDLFLSYEKRYRPVRVHDACGLELYYNEKQFADAFVIIDPEKPETFRAEMDLKKMGMRN